MEIIQHVYVVLPGIQYEPNGSLSVDRIEVRAKVNNNYTQLYSCYEEAGQEVIYPEASPSTSEEIPYLEFIKIDDEENQSITGYTSTKFVYTSPHADIKRAKDNYFFQFDLKEDGTNYKCLSVYDKAVEYQNNVTNTDGICFVPVAYSSDIVTFEIKLFSQVRYKSDTDEYSDKNYVYLDTVVFKYSPLIDTPVSCLTFKDDYIDMYYSLSSIARDYYDLKLNDNVIVYKDNGSEKTIMVYDNGSGCYKDTEIELDIEKTLLWVHPQFGVNGWNTEDMEDYSTTYKKRDSSGKPFIFIPRMPTIKCSTQPVRYPPFYFGNNQDTLLIESKDTVEYETEGGGSYSTTDPLEMSERDYFALKSKGEYAWDGGQRQRLAINMACASPILKVLYPSKYNKSFDVVVGKSEELAYCPPYYGDPGDYDPSKIDSMLEEREYWLTSAFDQLKKMGIYYTNLLKPQYINNVDTSVSFCFKQDDNKDKYNFNYTSNFINITADGYNYCNQGDKGEDQIWSSTQPRGSSSVFYNYPTGVGQNDRGYWPFGYNTWHITKQRDIPNYKSEEFKLITQNLIGGLWTSYVHYKYANDTTIKPKYLALYDNKDPKITIVNHSNIGPIKIDWSSTTQGSTITATNSSKHTLIKEGHSQTVAIKDMEYKMECENYTLPECWLAVNYNTSDLRFSNKSDYQIRPKLTLLQGDTRYGVYEGSMVIANVSQENLMKEQPWNKGLHKHVYNIYFNTQDRYYSIYSKDHNLNNTKKTYSMSLTPGLYVLSINVEKYTQYYEYDSSYESLCTLTIGDETYTSEKRAGEVLVAFYIKDASTTVHLSLSSYAFSHGDYGGAFTTGVGIHQVDYTTDITEAIYNTNIKNIIADCDNTVIFDQGHDIYNNIIFQGVLSYTQLISSGSHGTYYYIELPESHQKIVACYSFDDNGNLVYTDKVQHKNSTKSFSKHQLPDKTVEEILNVAEPKILA